MIFDYELKADFENVCKARKLESWAFEQMELNDNFKCANFIFYFTQKVTFSYSLMKFKNDNNKLYV